MTENQVVVLVMLFIVLVFTYIAYRVMLKHEIEFQNSLPSLDEAKQKIESKYPEHTNSFKLTKKVTDVIYAFRGSPAFVYGDFLVSEELGISIRVRLGEKMG